MTDPTLGIYIHVPFCKHACPYCDFYKVELRNFPARRRIEFPEKLEAEFHETLQEFQGLSSRRLETVYFGGGTPSTLVPARVGAFVQAVFSQFAQSAGTEVTLEANPENLTAGRASAWREAGITRLSIGVQSFHEPDLQLLERLHQPETIFSAVENAREAGFRNISLDLMFALPGQTPEGWMDNLRRAVSLQPEHVSFYGLTYHEGTPFEVWRRAGRLKPLDDDLQAEMYLRGVDFLVSEGYEPYEISNFARPGFRSRHNQRYWDRRDVLALGPGAHGNINDRRWANVEDLETWWQGISEGRLVRSFEETISPESEREERLFTGLRRIEGISAASTPGLFAACRDWYEANLPESEKWMHLDENRAALTLEGRLIADAISDAVGERLRAQPSPPPDSTPS